MEKSTSTVHIISIGGTISMTSDSENNALLPSLDGEDLLGSLSSDDLRNQIQVISPYNLPSGHLEYRHLVDLSKQVNELAVSNPELGIIITMGTDTLEEVAYFLDLTYRHDNPVIVMGAMRGPSQAGADGTRNLVDALVCARSSDCGGLGVIVVMNGEIHAAADVVKMHTTDVSSFKSPQASALGRVQEERVSLLRRPLKREWVELKDFNHSVELIHCTVGDTGRTMQVLLDSGATGFVVEGLGAGHVTLGMRHVVSKAIIKGVPVVITSRCISGGTLRNTYGYKGSEIDLRALGAYFDEGLNGPKALIKLSVLLGNPATRNRLDEFFTG